MTRLAPLLHARATLGGAASDRHIRNIDFIRQLGLQTEIHYKFIATGAGGS